MQLDENKKSDTSSQYRANTKIFFENASQEIGDRFKTINESPKEVKLSPELRKKDIAIFMGTDHHELES